MQCAGSCGKANQGLSVDTLRHPCYSFEGHQKYARMHIPVAPTCNISCNYCNRRYDCVNESRPGVTSEILTPDMALAKFKRVHAKLDNLTVIGIAGPGDALANWENTKTSIQLIQNEKPNTVFCLSTNGLLLPDLAADIISLGIRHVTVTINCTDPAIGAKIYKNVSYKGTTYTGEAGAALLLKNQLAGVRMLTSQNILVKINIVMIEGINDHHIPEVVETVKNLGVFISNIMPLIPAQGSAFAHHAQTSRKDLEKMRTFCEAHLSQMRHCQQCRADAIGLLHEDRSAEFRTVAPADKPEVYGGKPIKSLWQPNTENWWINTSAMCRSLPFTAADPAGLPWWKNARLHQYCLGVDECDETDDRRGKIINTPADCDAVLTMRIGYYAKQRLQAKGILSVESCDIVESGLVFALDELKKKESA